MAERIDLAVAPPELALAIRGERTARKWTRNQLAADLDVDPSTIYRIENGTTPSRDLRAKLCKRFPSLKEQLDALTVAEDAAIAARVTERAARIGANDAASESGPHPAQPSSSQPTGTGER